MWRLSERASETKIWERGSNRDPRRETHRGSFLVFCPVDTGAKSVELGEDRVGAGRPDERPAGLVVVGDEVVELGDQVCTELNEPRRIALSLMCAKKRSTRLSHRGAAVAVRRDPAPGRSSAAKAAAAPGMRIGSDERRHSSQQPRCVHDRPKPAQTPLTKPGASLRMLPWAALPAGPGRRRLSEDCLMRRTAA